MCQVSYVMCDFFLTKRLSSWWRVCYQQGLRRLVLTGAPIICLSTGSKCKSLKWTFDWENLDCPSEEKNHSVASILQCATFWVASSYFLSSAVEAAQVFWLPKESTIAKPRLCKTTTNITMKITTTKCCKMSWWRIVGGGTMSCGLISLMSKCLGSRM